jgi:hypothetical protein
VQLQIVRVKGLVTRERLTVQLNPLSQPCVHEAAATLLQGTVLSVRAPMILEAPLVLVEIKVNYLPVMAQDNMAYSPYLFLPLVF